MKTGDSVIIRGRWVSLINRADAVMPHWAVDPEIDGQVVFDEKEMVLPVCDDKRHLVAIPYTRSNLHLVARMFGIKPGWFHKTHYDIPQFRRALVEDMCVKVSPKDIVRITRGEQPTEESIRHLRMMKLAGAEPRPANVDLRIYQSYLGVLSLLGRVSRKLGPHDDDRYGVERAFADANLVLAHRNSNVIFEPDSRGGWSAFDKEPEALPT